MDKENDKEIDKEMDKENYNKTENREGVWNYFISITMIF